MKRISKKTDIWIRVVILLSFVALYVLTYFTRSVVLMVVSAGSMIYFLRFAYIEAQRQDKHSGV